MNSPGKDATAFIIAGGKSSRMGEDKAFLQFEGKSLLQRALQLAGNVGDTHIVGSAKKFGRFAPVIEDIFQERGPLGGIHAALRSTQTELNLMLAVDLPFVRSEFLRYLVECSHESGAIVTVPRCEKTFQPLCAVYRREFASVAEKSLEAKRNKVDASFSGLKLRVIDEQELAAEGFSADMFRNLNTREDWERAKAEHPQ